MYYYLQKTSMSIIKMSEEGQLIQLLKKFKKKTYKQNCFVKSFTKLYHVP